jgi:BON domain
MVAVLARRAAGVVYLTGLADNRYLAENAVAVARQVKGVTDVISSVSVDQSTIRGDYIKSISNIDTPHGRERRLFQQGWAGTCSPSPTAIVFVALWTQVAASS